MVQLFADDDTFENLLENRGVMEKVSCALMKWGAQDWKDLASELGIPRSTYLSFEPEQPESPTKQLIQVIVNENQRLTVVELLQAIVLISREDVFKKIEPHFKGKLSALQMALEGRTSGAPIHMNSWCPLGC